jgi:polyhydroxybutyrate depolymerase
MGNRFLLLAAALALLITTAPQAIHAQGAAAPVQACWQDARQYCTGVPPGGGRIVQCLIAHGDQLSPGCVSALKGAGAALQSGQTQTRPSANDEQHILTRDGRERLYFVHLPPQYGQGISLPVVIALHGGGGSAETMEEDYNLDPYADRAGMIVVYPEGTPSPIGKFYTWNAGICCGRAKKVNSDDVGFIAAVIDDVIARYHADPHRIFVTGHSNGAMMAYIIACELPSRTAAIAPVDGDDPLPCPHRTPVPVLQVHGTQDQCVPFEGGTCGTCFSKVLPLPGSDLSYACLPVPETLARLAAAYGCQAATKPTFSRGPVHCETWQGCPGAGVTLCRIDGGGHQWQGAKLPAFCDRRPQGRLCARYTEEIGPLLPNVDVNALIFEFFGGIRGK